MAISQTMSNSRDWIFQSYQADFPSSNQTETLPSDIAAATADATAATAISRNYNNLSPDQGRVSKPLRRRSRASRRTPTTLLNTDTTNFRAMVQQFTGSPTTPFGARSLQLPNGGATLNFTQHINAAAAAAPAASSFHVQYPNQLRQEHMFMINNMRGGGLSLHAAAPPEVAGSTANENQNYDKYVL